MKTEEYNEEKNIRRMNKTLLIAIIAVLILGLGGVFAFMTLSKSENGVPAISQEMSETRESQPASLRELMTSAPNRQCSFTDLETDSNGVVYLGSGQMRGDFNSAFEGTSTTSHMISTGEDVYIWMDGQQTGFKVSLSTLSNPSLQNQAAKSFDPDKKIDYSCTSWTPDASKFALPTIEFTDFSSMMPSNAVQPTGATGTEDLKVSQCAACNSLPESSKAQCLQALACE